MTSRRTLLGALGALWCRGDALAHTNDVTVSILRLLHPRLLLLTAPGAGRLRASFEGREQIIEGGAELPISGGLTPLAVSGAGGGPASFLLAIPGTLRRRYFGTLTVQASDGVLEPVVRMSLEIAVSSIVGAELPVAAAPLAALSAQAVVARSFLQAGGRRHPRTDFCDTTHCQFLRSPAAANTDAARAVAGTTGLVLTTEGRAFPALYSAACGGVTEPAARDGFLYQRVSCESCRRSRTARQGHGFGLCQAGAMELARQGWTWQRILATYYPGAAVARGQPAPR